MRAMAETGYFTEVLEFDADRRAVERHHVGLELVHISQAAIAVVEVGLAVIVDERIQL